MANYANNYRKSSAYRASASPQRGLGPVPTPANDNWQIPSPANDNFRNMPRPKQFAKAALRLGRALPLRYLDWGQDLWAIGQMLSNPEHNTYAWVQGPYTTRAYCSGGPSGGDLGTFSGLYANLLYTTCPTPLQSVGGAPISGFTSNAGSISSMNYYRCPGFPGATSEASCPVLNRRYIAMASWQRNAGVSGTQVRPHQSYSNAILPAVSPNVDPLEIPIFQDVPLYRPVPWHQAAQVAARKEKQLEWIAPYRREASPIPVPRPLPLPSGKPYINLNPETLPEGGVSVGVYPQTRPALAGGYKFRPPGRGEKEKKLKLQLGGTLAGAAVNMITESLDVLNAFWAALPRTSREGWRNPTPQKKVEILYRHINEVNYSKAFENLLVNEFEDRVIGGVSRRLQKTYRANWERYGLRGGYQLGPAL